MKILHVIPGMTSSSGPTQALKLMSGILADAGHEVSIVSLTDWFKHPAISEHPAVQQQTFPVQYLQPWGYSPAMKTYMNEHVMDFDVVHIHSMWLYPNVAAAHAARRHGVPYIIRPAGSLEPWCFNRRQWKKRPYFELLEKPILRGAAAIHAVSEQEALNIRAFGLNDRVMVVPNALDLDAFEIDESVAESRAALGLPTDRPILLFLSRIHPKKGLPMLGEILSQVMQTHPDVALAIVGPKEHAYAQEIKALYQSMGLSDAVYFLGERTGKEKARAYHAADLFVLPTSSENFGIVVVEALAAGLPVVVSDQTPWQVVNEEACGAWLPLEVPRFVEAINRYLDDDAGREKMSRIGCALAQREFGSATLSRRLVEMYTTVQDGS